MLENILIDTVHDVIEGAEFDTMIDRCAHRPPGLFKFNTSDDNAPNCNDITGELPVDMPKYKNQYPEKLEQELIQSSGQDEKEIFRKRMFLDKNFTNLLEFMLEDTLFNLMEEATYEEFDLTQAPKIYIRKEEAKKEEDG